MFRRDSAILLTMALMVTVATGQTVTGSGTPGTVPVFTGSSTIGNSPITISGSNVGIGTSSPATNLDVVGGNVNLYAGHNTGTATIGSSNSTAPLYEFAGAQTQPDGTHAGGFGIISGSNIVSPVIWMYNYGGYNAFQVRTVGYNSTPASGNVLFDVDASGNVGIGTTAPNATLEVNGTAQVDGALNVGNAGIVFPNGGGTQTVAYTGVTCGGDYAESVDVSGDRTKYEPGDVLVIDPDHDGKFLKSAEPYSTAVTGIYSTKPGTLGRRQLTPKTDAEVPMAMIGIVPTKVSAENGPIRRGDLLVTSSTIGYAMKGTDRSLLTGAVIGKALGNLESGKGVIEVVVTLQ